MYSLANIFVVFSADIQVLLFIHLHGLLEPFQHVNNAFHRVDYSPKHHSHCVLALISFDIHPVGHGLVIQFADLVVHIHTIGPHALVPILLFLVPEIPYQNLLSNFAARDTLHYPLDLHLYH